MYSLPRPHKKKKKKETLDHYVHGATLYTEQCRVFFCLVFFTFNKQEFNVMWFSGKKSSLGRRVDSKRTTPKI